MCTTLSRATSNCSPKDDSMNFRRATSPSQQSRMAESWKRSAPTMPAAYPPSAKVVAASRPTSVARTVTAFGVSGVRSSSRIRPSFDVHLLVPIRSQRQHPHLPLAYSAFERRLQGIRPLLDAGPSGRREGFSNGHQLDGGNRLHGRFHHDHPAAFRTAAERFPDGFRFSRLQHGVILHHNDGLVLPALFTH